MVTWSARSAVLLTVVLALAACTAPTEPTPDPPAPSPSVSSAPDAAAPGEIVIEVGLPWTGDRPCVEPREGSVTCVKGEGEIPGLGHVEYARDAVRERTSTADGCAMFSTHGHLYVDGGDADFVGEPADTCGAGDPDAFYEFTFTEGHGTLAGITGSGTILAESSRDWWKGTLTAPALAPLG